MAIPRLTITQHDGTELTVTPNLGDTLAFEQMLRKNPRLGKVQDNVLTAGPFRAWSAARREGLTTQSWEDFTSGPQAALHVGEAEDDTESEGDELGLGGLTTQHMA